MKASDGIFCPYCERHDTISYIKGEMMDGDKDWMTTSERYHCSNCNTDFTARVEWKLESFTLHDDYGIELVRMFTDIRR